MNNKKIGELFCKKVPHRSVYCDIITADNMSLIDSKGRKQ